jgi:putative glycosyltransferase (TIGR04348 family)
MKISLITPAPKGSHHGNRVTAERWAAILRGLGHGVSIATSWDEKPADMMIALDAWRSAETIRRWRETDAAGPLIVALTGPDIYRYQHSHPDETLESMARADRLVGLHDLVHNDIPARFHRKLAIIHQSAAPMRRAAPTARWFEVLVVGPLREEKDPMRTAFAVRELPESSRLRVIHLGGAEEPVWADSARGEMDRNPRYIWKGDVTRSEVRRHMARAQAMVLSSHMEGGANAISEAVMTRLPVLATAIPGSAGLLGLDYPGYFPAGDAVSLRQLLQRCEGEPDFLALLSRQGQMRAALFRPARERAAWRALIAALVPGGRTGRRVG